MTNEQHSTPASRQAIEAAEIARLARRAIAVLAADRPGRADGITQRLGQLCDAFLSLDED